MKDPPNHVSQRQERQQDREGSPYAQEDARPVGRMRKKKLSKTAQAATNQDPRDEFVHTPWLASLPERKYESAEKRLHDEIVAYTMYMEPTPEETLVRQHVFLAVRRVVKKLFHDADVNVYGSAATGLCLPDSDMDIIILTQRCRKVKESLFSLARLLKNEGLTLDVTVNHFARVPIVSFTTLPEYGAFNIDIGINNADGLRSRALVAEYLSSMPALRPLVLVMKGFLRQRRLNNAARAGLGSYAAIMMCVSFLQLNPAARPASHLTSPMDTSSLGTLLADFFYYYGMQFPYAESYISVSQAALLPKSEATWLKEADRAPGGWRMVIQCPMNPENDVSKSIDKPSMQRLVEGFKHASTHIFQLSSMERNMLGPIVSLNQSTINYRQHMREIVQYGLIDRLWIDYDPSMNMRQRSFQQQQVSSSSRRMSGYSHLTYSNPQAPNSHLLPSHPHYTQPPYDYAPASQAHYSPGPQAHYPPGFQAHYPHPHQTHYPPPPQRQYSQPYRPGYPLRAQGPSHPPYAQMQWPPPVPGSVPAPPPILLTGVSKVAEAKGGRRPDGEGNTGKRKRKGKGKGKGKGKEEEGEVAQKMAKDKRMKKEGGELGKRKVEEEDVAMLPVQDKPMAPVRDKAKPLVKAEMTRSPGKVLLSPPGDKELLAMDAVDSRTKPTLLSNDKELRMISKAEERGVRTALQARWEDGKVSNEEVGGDVKRDESDLEEVVMPPREKWTSQPAKPRSLFTRNTDYKPPGGIQKERRKQQTQIRKKAKRQKVGAGSREGQGRGAGAGERSGRSGGRM